MWQLPLTVPGLGSFKKESDTFQGDVKCSLMSQPFQPLCGYRLASPRWSKLLCDNWALLESDLTALCEASAQDAAAGTGALGRPDSKGENSGWGCGVIDTYIRQSPKSGDCPYRSGTSGHPMVHHPSAHNATLTRFVPQPCSVLATGWGGGFASLRFPGDVQSLKTEERPVSYFYKKKKTKVPLAKAKLLISHV